MKNTLEKPPKSQKTKKQPNKQPNKQQCAQKLSDNLPQLLHNILQDCESLTGSADPEYMHTIMEKHKSLKLILQNIELLLTLNPPTNDDESETVHSLIESARAALNQLEK